MKVTINREMFLKSLQLCSSAIPNRTVIPIYSSIKMVIEDGVAMFTGGCNNVQISASCNVISSDDAFGICLPPQLLIGTLSALSDEEVSFTSKKNDSNSVDIILLSGKKKYKMTGFPAEYYPMIQNAAIDPVIVKSHDFQKAFGNASICVDTKNLIETMQGCKVMVKDKEMIIYGISNAYMTRQTIGVVGENDRMDPFIIPAEISSLLNPVTDAGDAYISFDGKIIQVSMGGITVKSICKYGKYPDMESIIVRRPQTCVKFNNDEMVESLKRLKGYTSNTNIVKLKIKSGEIIAGADDSDVGKAAVEFLEKDVYSDLETEKWYNIKYMSNIFSNLDTSNTVMYLSENNQVPAFIAPDNSTDAIKQLWIIASLDYTKLQSK